MRGINDIIDRCCVKSFHALFFFSAEVVVQVFPFPLFHSRFDLAKGHRNQFLIDRKPIS